MPATRGRPPSTRRSSAAIALLGVGLLLAGCSGSNGSDGSVVEEPQAEGSDATQEAVTDESTEPYAGLEPAQILDRATETMEAATSVRVTADIDQGGETISINLLMNRSERAKGTLATGSDGSMKLIRIGDTGYFQPGEDMLEQIADGDDEVKDYLTGKWLTFSKGGDMDENFDLTDMDGLLGELVSTDGGSGNIVQVKGKTFDGVETVGLKQKGTEGVVYVAADGSGEVVAARDPDGTLVFSDWNTKVSVKKPKNVIPLE